MARHLVEDVHAFFRGCFHDVLARSRRSGGVDASGFAAANRMLHGHHQTEDVMWFPRLSAAHGADVAAGVRELSRDHAALVELEARVLVGSLDALSEFVARLDEHLDLEECLTV